MTNNRTPRFTVVGGKAAHHGPDADVGHRTKIWTNRDAQCCSEWAVRGSKRI